MVNLGDGINVPPGGRTQIVLPAMAGIQSLVVDQVVRGHTHLTMKGGGVLRERPNNRRSMNQITRTRHTPKIRST
jgi:hypothetical protein